MAGVPFSALVGTLTDANPQATAAEHAVTIDWGDGTTSPATLASLGAGQFGIVANHVYATAGTRTLLITATDDEGARASGAGSADVGSTDFRLTAEGITIETMAGLPFSGVVARFTDADPNGGMGDFSALIDWGDGQISTGTISVLADGGFGVGGTHTYTEPGILPVRVDIADIGGSNATAEAQARIERVNAVPVWPTLPDHAIDEGSEFSLIVAATDPDGDPLQYRLLTAPAGAALDADSGVLHWFAAAGPVHETFTIGARDASGNETTQSFAVDVLNLAPTLTVIGAMTGQAGQTYTLTLGATDPGADHLTGWTLAWGDGTVETLTGTATSASHVYATAGAYSIAATATDEDGSYPAPAPTVDIAPPPLRVTDFTPTATGFTVRFDGRFDPTAVDFDDVRLDGDLVGGVSGSLVLDPDEQGFTFRREGGYTLQYDHYHLRLLSGPAAFHNARGDLDGDADGQPGGDYVGGFDRLGSGQGLASIKDFMRGPGQPVNLPANGVGLPLRFEHGGGARSLVLTLAYDPQALTLIGAQAGTDLPAGTELRFATETLGTQILARITLILPGDQTLPAGTLNLLRLTAAVPAGALYGQRDRLTLRVESLNGSPVSNGQSEALHLVGYLGDADRDARYTKNDVTLIGNLILKKATSLPAWPGIDPLLVADINGDGRFSSGDASYVTAMVNGTGNPLIPPMPAGLNVQFALVAAPTRPLSVDGATALPRLSLPTELRARAGQRIDIPVSLSGVGQVNSLRLRLQYDSTRLHLVGAHTGQAGDRVKLLPVPGHPHRCRVAWRRDADRPATPDTVITLSFEVRNHAHGTAELRLTRGAVDGQRMRSAGRMALGALLIEAPTPVIDWEGRLDLTGLGTQSKRTPQKKLPTWQTDFLAGTRVGKPLPAIAIRLPSSAPPNG